MDKITKALDKVVDLHPRTIKDELLSTFDDLERTISELERPEYRPFITFAVAWQKLDRELAALQRTIHERLSTKPINPIDQFLAKLVKKN